MFILRNLLKYSKSLAMTEEIQAKCVPKLHYNNKNLQKIFQKALEAVNPRKLIRDNVQLKGENLIIRDRNYSLKNKIYVVGFGKAVLHMSTEIEAILGTNLKSGVISIPTGTLSTEEVNQMAERSKIRIIQAAQNNIPDLKSIYAAEEICKLVESLQKNDLLIVLISGGGSALFTLPIPPVFLSEKSEMILYLSKNGADINELNTFRKKVSQVKGGGLARKAFPAYIVSLILSDVIDDPLDIIASGPTLPNKDKPDAALNITKKYGATLSKKMLEVLNAPYIDDKIPLNPIGGYFHVENNLIGNNKLMINAAKEYASKRHYESVIISNRITGNVSDLAKFYAEFAIDLVDVILGFSSGHFLTLKYEDEKRIDIKNTLPDVLKMNFYNKKGICLIGGGEPTLHVLGRGKGGRNQHLALLFSSELHKILQKRPDLQEVCISFLSCGTDGIDGPTDAAGALGNSKLYANALKQDLDPAKYLRNYDSYNFYSEFSKGEFLVKTGHTGTNVMDLHLLMINSENNDGFSPVKRSEILPVHC